MIELSQYRVQTLIWSLKSTSGSFGVLENQTFPPLLWQFAEPCSRVGKCTIGGHKIRAKQQPSNNSSGSPVFKLSPKWPHCFLAEFSLHQQEAAGFLSPSATRYLSLQYIELHRPPSQLPDFYQLGNPWSGVVARVSDDLFRWPVRRHWGNNSFSTHEIQALTILEEVCIARLHYLYKARVALRYPGPRRNMTTDGEVHLSNYRDDNTVYRWSLHAAYCVSCNQKRRW